MLKIAVPWPVKPSAQPRIKEALDLWSDKSNLMLCLVEESTDPYLKPFDKALMPRDSTSIGTEIRKCFIHDMVKTVKEQHPGLEWYGFGNSDVVPVGDLLENSNGYDTLIFHRTDIKEWEYRFRKNVRPIERSTSDLIFEMRQAGIDDRKLARHLNLQGIAPPHGHNEWTYANIRELFIDQGTVFFWGQDLYLFRASIVDRVIEEYLKVHDPILGSGGFDPRLTRWLLSNFNGARMINKIFHKGHDSEWNVHEIEYNHNGGDIPQDERELYYNETFVQTLCDQGQLGAIPKYIRYLVGRKNPELMKKLFPQLAKEASPESSQAPTS
jgi:hypothetical protein